jgi:hypothetical protein
MKSAATLGHAPVARLIDELPRYETYISRRCAVQGERSFRLAVGRLLKACGDQLLSVAERQPQLITTEQSEMIDGLVEEVGSILRRLNRQGEIKLAGERRDTIAELEEIDLRLVLLLERAFALVEKLENGIAATEWFQRDAARLSRGLEDFEVATEERNFLLGLGWESELHPRPRRPRAKPDDGARDDAPAGASKTKTRKRG